jgi:hypothetical protein
MGKVMPHAFQKGCFKDRDDSKLETWPSNPPVRFPSKSGFPFQGAALGRLLILTLKTNKATLPPCLPAPG